MHPSAALLAEAQHNMVFQECALIADKKVLLLDSRPDSLSLAREIAVCRDEAGNEDAFMLMNLDRVLDRFQLWNQELPEIMPFFAVKCNNDPVFLSVLAAMGAGFDCASREEIDLITGMGVAPERIVYAHTTKLSGSIRHAKEKGVMKMTFDSEEELEKTKRIHPDAQLILRISVSDPTASLQLNLKFGAEPEEDAPRLLQKAKDLGLKIAGISFHIGSGSNDTAAFRTAIQYARALTDLGRSLGHPMNILDIGGGFPGKEHNPGFEQYAQVIRSSIGEFFPDNDVTVIAEPGRFFAAKPCTLVANVFHRTEVPAHRITGNANDSGPGYMYYINDGHYQSFAPFLFHVRPVGFPLIEKEGPTFPSVIWGPTCDCSDQVENNKQLRKMEIGEWIVYEHMGAYSMSPCSTFNGFQPPKPIYVISREAWKTITSRVKRSATRA